MDYPRHLAVPTAPYSARPPSPPSIHIPTPMLYNSNEPIKVVPSYDNIDPASLSLDDLQIITQNGKEQIAHDSATSWVYESRRTAQPILDYLYLGPASVARDRQWLRDHGITMLLAARDAQMAHVRLMAVDHVARELGIQAEHIDVSGYHELIRAFPTAVRKINDHMLSIYRRQALQRETSQVRALQEQGQGAGPDGGRAAGGGQMVIDEAKFRRGRVLVFCETGNERSAGIVVAYLMSVLGMDMVHACQFIHYKRFCVGLDEDLKQLLKNYEDILTAQRTVHRHEIDAKAALEGSPDSSTAPASTTTTAATTATTSSKKVKRGFEEAMDGGDEDEDMADPVATDHERYLNREAFVPFVDRGDN
ncbi:hypothetical protein SLS62_003967 [Diatrype stigma]|uniref:Tyrosine-protein phosphatase domain-containing protein n=1 Tax=Diatrype stigma TaxID=117547 RepID=A0AAN9UUB7_9PEZI